MQNASGSDLHEQRWPFGVDSELGGERSIVAVATVRGGSARLRWRFEERGCGGAGQNAPIKKMYSPGGVRHSIHMRSGISVRSAAVDLGVYLTLATVEENTATASDCGESV